MTPEGVRIIKRITPCPETTCQWYGKYRVNIIGTAAYSQFLGILMVCIWCNRFEKQDMFKDKEITKPTPKKSWWRRLWNK